ncbi:MAG: T9SS type A sorting domain-containing protein [Flavobacterium sp.]|nr:T9SS type A sorting domain-containing protein [Flavobacterium sp.]
MSTPLSSSPVQYLYDAFVAKFDFAGNKTWGTYYGGNKNEISGNDSDISFPHTTVLINNSGTFYIAGETASENNIATAGSFQPSWNNLPNTNPNLYQEASNFYLAKFDPVPLSNQSFTFKELHYFPNPAKNTITISNASIIDSVDVISVLGQKISSKMGNNQEIQLDLSGLSNGVYFIKVYSNNDSSTFKIIKG